MLCSENCLLFQEYVVVFADMGHRRMLIGHNNKRKNDKT